MRTAVKLFHACATIVSIGVIIYVMSSGIIEHTRAVDNAALTGTFNVQK